MDEKISEEVEKQPINLQDLINLAIDNNIDFKSPITAIDEDNNEYIRLFTVAVVNKGNNKNDMPLIELT